MKRERSFAPVAPPTGRKRMRFLFDVFVLLSMKVSIGVYIDKYRLVGQR